MLYYYAGGNARVHFPTDTSDEEMMKLNFKYVVRDGEGDRDGGMGPGLGGKGWEKGKGMMGSAR